MKDEESSHPSANAGQQADDGAGSRGGGFGGGNRFAWHQDFAYWTEGNPYNRPVMPSPDVATAAVAIDRSGPENGALQMLKGSHKLGLLGYVAEPWGERYAEEASVQSALAAGCEIVVCEQEPGDVCFFNCLTFRPHHFPHSALRPQLKRLGVRRLLGGEHLAASALGVPLRLRQLGQRSPLQYAPPSPCTPGPSAR